MNSRKNSGGIDIFLANQLEDKDTSENKECATLIGLCQSMKGLLS